MSWNASLGRVERALPIVLVLNIIPWLFGAFGLMMVGEYGWYWGGDVLLALITFIYLPVATIGFILWHLVRWRDAAWNIVLSLLIIWGMLTAGVFFIAWILMLVPQ